MNREATEKLRLDRRLIHRRGWVSKAELTKELESLPDASHKIAPPEDQESTETAPAEERIFAAADAPETPPEVPPRVE
jgi:hypothetical protein